MRVCVILEGCYPYVTGGVSSWMHSYIQAMDEVEFVVVAIGADPEQRGRFRYELPGNVVEVREVCLTDAFASASAHADAPLGPDEHAAMRELVRCGRPDWELVFSLFQSARLTPTGFLMSQDFVGIVEELCENELADVAFADYFHTVRSMMLPLLHVLAQEMPPADVYHAISTGYGGIMARLGGWRHGRPYLITEHGIYTREREEEILRATWVEPVFKRSWVRFFYLLSEAAYDGAAQVTCLFDRALETQVEMGCARERCRVITNGIHDELLSGIGPKEPNGHVDIGAVLRIAPIKDVLTMIHAFAELKRRVPTARLFIAGPQDDPAYAHECRALIVQLGVRDVSFVGTVDVAQWLGRFDFTVLTSISEGQPLSVLESFAAGRPVVTTDVGCCKELVSGMKQGDDLGVAGLCVPPMQSHRIARAMETLCRDEDLRHRMGEVGRARVARYFRHQDMIERYRGVYEEVMGRGGHRLQPEPAL